MFQFYHSAQTFLDHLFEWNYCGGKRGQLLSKSYFRKCVQNGNPKSLFTFSNITGWRKTILKSNRLTSVVKVFILKVRYISASHFACRKEAFLETTFRMHKKVIPTQLQFLEFWSAYSACNILLQLYLYNCISWCISEFSQNTIHMYLEILHSLCDASASWDLYV